MARRSTKRPALRRSPIRAWGSARSSTNSWRGSTFVANQLVEDGVGLVEVLDADLAAASALVTNAPVVTAA
jgi:hypothetical protein